MYEPKQVKIKTPWKQVNDLLDGGLNSTGLCLLPTINFEVVQDFFAHVIACQALTYDVEEHRVNNKETITISYMDSRQTLPSLDATVSQYIADAVNTTVGPALSDSITFNDEYFAKKQLRFINWNTNSGTPIDETVTGIGEGLRGHKLDLRICLVNGLDLDDCSAATVRVILRELRMWALQNHATVLIAVPIAPNLIRFHDEQKNPLIDSRPDSPVCTFYHHMAINQEADYELLIGHNHIEQELVIRRGKYRGSVRPYGEEVRVDSLVGEFPKWDVM